VNRSRLIGILLGIVAGASWGTGPLFFKGYVLPAGVGWISMLFWRFAVAALVSWVWPLMQPRARAALLELDRRSIARLMAIGATFLANASVYYAAIERIDISLVALIMSSYPALVAVASIRLGYRLQGRLAWTSLFMVIGGTILTIGGVRPDVDQVGILLALSAPVLYSIYIMLTAWMAGERPGATADMRTSGRGAEVPPPVAGALMMTGTLIAAAILGVGTGEPILPGSVPAGAWPGLLGIAVFAGAIAIQAFYASAARIGAAQASLMATIEPVVVIVLGITFLGESFTAVRILGAAIVLAGVIVAQMATPPESRRVVLEEP
jgi:drug/metabolite transporter (DMT)-like permease